jgi:hypothetical protein
MARASAARPFAKALIGSAMASGLAGDVSVDGKLVEATSGIEPEYTVLQTVA